jgi:hypothetical protein
VKRADPFDVEALRLPADEVAALPRRTQRRPPRHRQGQRFLKGPIPWEWLERTFALKGKALHVALLLWQEAGCCNRRSVRLCLRGKLPVGLTRQSARRALRALAGAGLVTIGRLPGRGLEVTILDPPTDNEP